MSESITRKQFLQGGVVTAIVVSALGCASDDDTGDDGNADDSSGGGGDCSGGADGVISGNHGHSANVPAADITGAAAHDYDIMGTATHTHTISVSAAQMASLAGGDGVMVTSTMTAGHTHDVTLSC
jgi:hypothetical protein